MCGICGFADPGSRLSEPTRTLQQMVATLRHRGPDSSGIEFDESLAVGLGHTRLSILDTSDAASQPMVSRDGRIAMVFNGEIYNYRDLARRLLDAGHGNFQSTGDTEVLVEAFAAWGVAETLRRCNGMFAVAVLDRSRRRITLARDRVGIKPLYWGVVDSTLVFASELKAVRAAVGGSLEVDRAAVASFLHWNHVPSPHCIYEGMHKLAPGHLLEIDLELGVGAPGVRVGEPAAYWSVVEAMRNGHDTLLDLDPEEAVAELDAVLRRAVRRRMVSDVPLGAFLSGGIDSSVVVALMQELSDRPVRSFSIGFDEGRFDESPHARAVAAHLGTHHTTEVLESHRMIELVEHLPRIHDEPFADSSQIPTFYVCRMARDHVTVALSGDGGDELFHGYWTYAYTEAFARRNAQLAPWLRRTAALIVRHAPSSTLGWLLGAIRKRAGDRIAATASVAGIKRTARLLAMNDPRDIHAALMAYWPDPLGVARSSGESTSAHHLRPEGISLADHMMVTDMAGYLPDDILTKVDRASMAVSLEARVPLLDHEVVEFAWRVPFALKQREGQGKWLLRRVLEQYVPRELFDRPKTGFAVPLARWLREDLREWAEELLGDRRLRESDLLRVQPVRSAWRSLLDGDDRQARPLWAVLMLQSWLEEQSQPPGALDPPRANPSQVLS